MSTVRRHLEQGAPPAGARGPESGFSLIEVVITIGILMTLTLAVASMLRSGFDVKEGLSQRAKVVHRLAGSINKLADDVEHAFFVSPKDQLRMGIGRRMKTAFVIEKGSGADKLKLTTKTHRPLIAGVPESELTYVVYELREAKEAPGRKHLFRGEYKAIPDDLKEDPPMQILARNIKTLTIQPWIGDRWSNDYWDTNRGDTRGKLPRMVKITIEANSEERTEGDGKDESADQGSDKIITVVNLSESAEYPELKQPDSSIKWSNL